MENNFNESMNLGNMVTNLEYQIRYDELGDKEDILFSI